MDDESVPAWVNRAQAHGWNSTLLWALDAFDPLGIWFAQALFALYPFARILGADEAWQDIAQALETPEGRNQLRHWLSAKPLAHPNADAEEKDA